MTRFARLVRRVTATAVALLLMTVSAAPSPAEDDVPVLPARIAKDLLVEGRWRMTGDVEVAPGATLRFAAGAVVATTGTIRVHGRIVADGTPDRPVVLGPAGDAVRDGGDGLDAATAPWRGIELHSDRSRTPDSVLRGVKLSAALEAVAVGDGEPTISQCVFWRCGAGVAAGNLWTVERTISEQLRSPRP
ncbi:MAG: hypothetical protein K8T90_13565 [Planctomycetes bacterium]|nr:hypothetical protein [Planctomycetota bacterium]